MIGRRHDGVRIRRAAKTESEQRNAAHCALLDGPRNLAVKAFFQQDARHVRGDPEAQIRGGSRGQFQRRAPSNDLFRPPLLQLERALRLDDLATHGGVVDRLRGLPLLRIDDHMVHQVAGHVYLLGIDRAGAHYPLHLRNDNSFVVTRRQRLIQSAEKGGLVLEGQISPLIGRRRSDDRHAWGDDREEQPLVARERNLLDDRYRRSAPIHGAALQLRIDEGAQANFREHARTLRGGVAHHVEQDAARHVVGRNLIVDNQPPDFRHRK